MFSPGDTQRGCCCRTELKQAALKAIFVMSHAVVLSSENLADGIKVLFGKDFYLNLEYRKRLISCRGMFM